MMDPLAALSIAAAVIQFVDFGLTLVSEGVEFYESGSLAKNDELELITKDLTRLTHDKLLPQSLRVQPSGNQFKHGLESFRKSLRSTMKKGKIQSIDNRLERVQGQVKMNILNLLTLSSIVSTCSDEGAYSIKEAYTETFEWIFNEIDFKRLSFLQWLRQGDGIYWISGKARSGKSTLTKLLSDSRRTKSALRVWAGNEKLVTASFFFWNAGSMVEKPHQGLLQSILYQILKQCPNLIPTICSSRWHFNATDHELDGTWNRKELDESFHRLKDQLLSAKFCFVIDGLDEYDALSLSIKIYASSRPWNAFEKAFGHNLDQKLCLQDFTKNDIRLYAKGKLEEDASFSMKKSMDSRYDQLIEDIVERSSGVFLWVYLVVRSLLRGLTDENDFAFLRKRLDHFPSDLRDDFRHMLNSNGDFYRKQAARIFLVMLNRNFSRNFSLTALSFHYLEKVQDNPNHALDRNLKRIPNEDGFNISEQLKRYLNACCKDLVEVKHSLEHKGEYNRSYRGISFAFMEHHVEFLHRTVKDFFLDEEILPLLKARSGTGFDPKVALCNVLLAQFKGLPDSAFFFPKIAQVTRWVENMPNEVMTLARDAEIRNKRPELALLNELESTMLARSQLPKGQFSKDDSVGPPNSPHSKDFLASVTRAGLYLHLAAKLDSEP
ncbi:hypothetical protein BDZ45DRAFT_755757 [Acephala macrosclerotiorum]|nr:hypothetical protein BDZ45DRAFT_755757 [Acephala macrosclerotiorum]